MKAIRDIMSMAPVIPVIVIDDLESAVPMANALVEGGLLALEITLRTPVALQAIKKIAAEVPEAVVGVGTVNSTEQMHSAKEHGAVFAVSPGYTTALGQAAVDADLAYLPGVISPSEILMAMGDGLDALKFFPAAKAGGAGFLKDLSGPFQEIVFCPTGGINAANKDEYLQLDNVLCVGGSWVAPKDLVKLGDWAGITRLAQEASKR